MPELRSASEAFVSSPLKLFEYRHLHALAFNLLFGLLLLPARPFLKAPFLQD